MTNRMLAHIVRDQSPLVLRLDASIADACRAMRERRAGSVLVVDGKSHLAGIFTGRDAVRALAEGRNGAATRLAEVMTANPVTIAPTRTAIDALRAMWNGGFRHLPVVEHGRILGIVSRGDFKGMEIDRLDEEEHLWECIR
jgi:CBS domain-containing protein